MLGPKGLAIKRVNYSPDSPVKPHHNMQLMDIKHIEKEKTPLVQDGFRMLVPD